jgi:SanA protein
MCDATDTNFMLKKLHATSFKTTLLALLVFFIFAATSPFLLTFTTQLTYNSHIFPSAKVPNGSVALVLGAGIRPDGSPSDILRDRIEKAVELYKSGKVKTLIMSGDNRRKDYNEPQTMKERAMALGVPENDIQLDYAGRRTYDSCWRAKHIFSQEKITIVTQSFHMTRALFLCEHLGVESVGVLADQHRNSYQPSQWLVWQFRDILSLVQAHIDIFVVKPPVVGGEKIQITDNGLPSSDQ